MVIQLKTFIGGLMKTCWRCSTKHLLNNAVKQASGNLPLFGDVDQTYKVLKNNYPLSVVGTVNINHKFYLIGAGFSHFEGGPSISLMLETTKICATFFVSV